MSTPWEQLATALAPDPDDGDPDAIVYPAFAEAGMVVGKDGAIVLQPDEPWIEPQAFGFDQERYVAIAAVLASAGREAGVAALYRLVLHIIRSAISVDGVAYESVGAPRVDDSTGTPYLAVAVRLTFRSCIEPS